MSNGPIPAPAIPMSTYQKSVLEELENRQKTGQQQVVRIKILLMAHEGFNNSEIKRELKISLNTVKKWRKRWNLVYQDLLESESNLELNKITVTAYRTQIIAALENLPRSGAPKRITLTEEQQIIALACDKPVHHGLELTDWTYEMLAKTAISENLIDTISATQVGRILKKKPITTA